MYVMYACDVCIHACMYVCMCVHVCMYVRMHVCMYLCKYVSMYVCMRVCMYPCMYGLRHAPNVLTPPHEGFHASCGQTPLQAMQANSEQVGLLHDAKELFFIHLAIAVTVGLIDHLLKLFVCHALAQLLGDTLQVLERDLTLNKSTYKQPFDVRSG